MAEASWSCRLSAEGKRIVVAIPYTCMHSYVYQICDTAARAVLAEGDLTHAKAGAAFRRYASSQVSYVERATRAIMRREGIDMACSVDRDSWKCSTDRVRRLAD